MLPANLLLLYFKIPAISFYMPAAAGPPNAETVLKHITHRKKIVMLRDKTILALRVPRVLASRIACDGFDGISRVQS